MRQFWYILCAVLVSACSFVNDDEYAPCPDSAVPVQLSLSLGGVQPSTRADVSQLKEIAPAADFRGITSVYLLPFNTGTAVTSEDLSIDRLSVLPAISADKDNMASADGGTYHSGLIKNNHAHLYAGTDARVAVGTSSALVYAPAVRIDEETPQASKHLNGSLVESGLDFVAGQVSASSITFSPDPIYSGGVPDAAQAIADAMNCIAEGAYYPLTYYYKRAGEWKSTSITVRWDSSIGSATLRGWYEDFTNEGLLLTGAGEHVSNMITSLYKNLKKYVSVDATPYYHIVGGESYPAMRVENGTDDDILTYADIYNGLRDYLIGRIESLEIPEDELDAKVLRRQPATGDFSSYVFDRAAVQSYPTSLGLPTGAAVLRWNGSKFITVVETLEGIAAIDRFCYMPPLYYYANTTISTSTDYDLYKSYTKDMESWDSILSLYRSPKVVSNRTTAVALDEPLQFATGMLQLTVKATIQNLPDNDGDAYTNCSATGTNFPVTGLIVGSQYRQTFDFVPDPLAPEAYYLYDNRVSGVYLTTTESAQLRSIVLPTPAEEDVYFFLELRNDSGKSFYGAEGIIMPGTHFYLAGCLDKPGEAETLRQVFTKDHVTTVHCAVNTLENAHVSIPELGDPQLMLGVKTTVDWVHSAASYIILD